MKQFTVSAVVPRLIVELLTQDRTGQEEIYREAKLDLALIDDIDRRVTYEDFRRFAGIANGKSHDPHLGLHAITSFFPGVLDLVSFTMLASATLLQAIETLAKYSPIIDESVEVTLRRESSIVWLVGRTLAGQSEPIVVDTAFAVTLRVLRLLGAGHAINVRAARFSYPPPQDTRLHASVLGCTDIDFGQIDNAISFRIEDLEKHIPRPSSIVSRFLNDLAENHLEFLKRTSLISIKVREVIARNIGRAPPTLSMVAAVLQMTPRTLQRALEREGVSFRGLVDETLRQHAHLRLLHSMRSTKEIAFELGFKEPRSFHRACTRWFGVPPAAYRARERRDQRSTVGQ